MAREVLFSSSPECSWIQHAARARKHRMLSEDQLSHWGREFIWVMLWGGGVEKLSALLYLQLKKSVLPGSNSRSLENEAHGIGDQEPSLQFRDGTVTYLLALAGKVFSVPCNILSPGISMKNLFLICCCSSSLHSHGYMAQHLWTAQGTHTQSQLHEWAWPQLPVDGCKFFRFVDKTWLFSRAKAWNETYQHNRDSIFQHHWLHSEPLIIQGCHRPWQSHFQAPPKKQKTAWNFSNQDPNPLFSLDINLLSRLDEKTVLSLCYERGLSKEKPTPTVRVWHLPV